VNTDMASMTSVRKFCRAAIDVPARVVTIAASRFGDPSLQT
jgi:hypothetical protein